MTTTQTKTPEHAHIEHLGATRLPTSPIYAFLLTPVTIQSATRGHVIAHLRLSPNHMNSAQSLHGAASATICDWMGGMAISSYDLRDMSGVSVDIHVTYQFGAKAGEVVEIEGIAEKVGGSLAFTKVNIFKVDAEGKRGQVVASGTHTKFVKGSEPSKISCREVSTVQSV